MGMKIYVIADMEGISGIHKMSQVKRENLFDYEYGKKRLMNEINHVVDVLFRLGAGEVWVQDAHTGGGNIELAGLDGRANYTPSLGARSLSLLDDSFDGLMIIGQHSKAGTLNGFLDHTINSTEWFQYRLNETEIGEVGLIAVRAGAVGVPVLAVSGDEATAKEARELLGDIPCAVVKYGIGRNWADCLPIEKAYERIAAAVEEGIRMIGKARPYRPVLPAKLELTFYRSDFADRYEAKGDGWTRMDGRTVQKEVRSFKEALW